MNSIELLAKRRVVFGRFRLRCSLALMTGVALLAFSPAARAQNTGSIFGSVVDATGAVIPNGTVTVTDTEHGVTRTTTSNATGEFQVQSLPVGTYILTVSAPSFETAVVTDIVVDAEKNVKETVKLLRGAASDTVTVQDDSGSTIDAKSATLGTLIDQKLIDDLPVDGHNIVALTALLPGVTDVNAPATFTGDTKGPTYSASGSRNTQNLMLFDGLMWNNLFFNTGINYPSPNALQEVSILLNNYKAQYGRNAGSVFNVITRRGTNSIHGAVWDYLQNQMFNASDYITKINPKDNINQFGFTVGGPVIKDKLYYFGFFQDLIGRLQTTATADVPGYNERGLQLQSNGTVAPRPCLSTGAYAGDTNGCASFITDVTGAQIVVGTGTNVGKFLNPIANSGSTSDPNAYAQATSMFNTAAGVTSGNSACVNLLTTAENYASSVNYAGGTKVQPTYSPWAEIPNECLNPVMMNMMNTFVPLPNTSNPNYTGLAVTTSPAPTGDKNLMLRGDYILNGQNSFDARYDYINSNQFSPQGVNSASTGIATYAITNQSAHSNFANVGWQWVVSPTMLNQMRVGYKRFESVQLPLDHRTLNSFGGNFVETGVPTLPAINFSLFSLGAASIAPNGATQGYQDSINENVEIREDLSYQRGNHTFQVGYDFLRLQYLNRQDYPGQLSYSTTFSGVGIADGLMGLVNQVYAQNRLNQGGIQHDDFFYAQDDWRATPKLTLSYGLRYELPFQWFEPHGEAATFIPGAQSTVFPGAPGGLAFPGDRGVLASLVPTDFNGIAPRLGFSYDTTGEGKVLIRGGYGIFFDAVNANVVGVGQPYHFQVNALQPLGGATSPLAGLGPNGTELVLPPGFNKANPQFLAPYSIFFPDPNFRTPYVQAVNLGFQWHIPHGGVLDTNYVGKFARKLTIPIDLNPAIFDCSGGYFQANAAQYCNNPTIKNSSGQSGSTTNVNSSGYSTAARVRYAPFNYGGQGIVDIVSEGTSNYNALQTQYTQRGGKHLTILASYTYSRSLDIQTNAQTTQNAVPNVFNLKSDYGPSDYNATHVFNLGWVFRLPLLTQGFAPLRAVLNNWVYSGTEVAHSGRPFSVTINNDTALDGEPNQRAQILPGVNPLLPKNRHRLDKVNEYFNVNAFTYPVVGTFSNQSRNSFVGPGYILSDMTLGRDFPLSKLREGMRMNFRAEGYNVFNTPNLANPYAIFSCSTTSTYTNSGANGSGTTNQPYNPGPLLSCVGAGGNFSLVNGSPQFGDLRSTFGNNANTSTNGRKMQFALTLYY